VLSCTYTAYHGHSVVSVGALLNVGVYVNSNRCLSDKITALYINIQQIHYFVEHHIKAKKAYFSAAHAQLRLYVLFLTLQDE
jgi:hypothetical protein